MVKRTYNTDDTEPEASNFKLPSEKEHLLQTTDIITNQDDVGVKMGLDDDTYAVKLEVVGGDEEGLTMLNRVSLNPHGKGFYYTRLFLKAIGEPYKGAFEADTGHWIGRQFYATVKHSESKGKTYANIDQYNFDKKVEQPFQPGTGQTIKPEDIQWEN